MSKTILAAALCAAALNAVASDEICGAPRLQERAEILWTRPLCKEPGRYIGILYVQRVFEDGRIR